MNKQTNKQTNKQQVTLLMTQILDQILNPKPTFDDADAVEITQLKQQQPFPFTRLGTLLLNGLGKRSNLEEHRLLGHDCKCTPQTLERDRGNVDPIQDNLTSSHLSHSVERHQQ
jgi:hypothetical protein